MTKKPQVHTATSAEVGIGDPIVHKPTRRFGKVVSISDDDLSIEIQWEDGTREFILVGDESIEFFII